MIYFLILVFIICATSIVLERRKAEKERFELATKYQELIKEHRKEIYRLQEEVKTRDKIISNTGRRLKDIVGGM